MEVKLTDDEYRDIIIRAYEYLYSMTTSQDDYVFKPLPEDQKSITRFIKYLHGSEHRENIEWILNFFETSYGYYARRKNNGWFGARSIMFRWIISENAVKRYEKVKTEYPNFPHFLKFMRARVKASLFTKFQVKTVMVSKIDDEKYIQINPVEEQFKELCKDDDRILQHCISGTFLYNHQSHKCVFCPKMTACKKILSLNYPNIYKLRGY